ncbi:MAG: metallophosphatase family protein [Spirochaetales bacterium]|nr:metallophosphatase family protein [Spirochaetales bacterium]
MGVTASAPERKEGSPQVYKLAVISDIHANRTALESVMEVIDGLEVDEIICLGDIIGKGAFPGETAEICRRRCSFTLLGNHEDFFLKDPAVDYYRWARKELSPDQLDWIRSLPLYQDRLISGRRMRFCHASPRDVHHRVYPREPDENKLKYFLPVNAGDESPDVLCYGDVHCAYMQGLGGERLLLNAGSVGNPLDLPQAVFLLIRGLFQSSRKAPYSFEFIRVPYDIEKEIRLTLASGIPERGRDIYIQELRQGAHGKRWSYYS